MRSCVIFIFFTLALTHVKPKDNPPNPTDMPLSSRDLVQNGERMRSYIKALNSIKVIPSVISRSSGSDADLLVGNERIPIPRNQKGLEQVTKIKLDRSKLQRYLDILNLESATKPATIEIDPSKVMQYVKILDDIDRATIIPNSLIYKSRIKMMKAPNQITYSDGKYENFNKNYGSSRVLRHIESQTRNQGYKIDEGIKSSNDVIKNEINLKLKKANATSDEYNNGSPTVYNDYEKIDFDVPASNIHKNIVNDGENYVSQDEYFLQNDNMYQENEPDSSALGGEMQNRNMYSGLSINSLDKSNEKEKSNINKIQNPIDCVVNSLNMDHEQLVRTGNFYTHSPETGEGLFSTIRSSVSQEYQAPGVSERDNKNSHSGLNQLKDANDSFQVTMGIPISSVTQQFENHSTEVGNTIIHDIGIYEQPLNVSRAIGTNYLTHEKKGEYNTNGISSIKAQNIYGTKDNTNSINPTNDVLDNRQNQTQGLIVQLNDSQNSINIQSNDPKNEEKAPVNYCENISLKTNLESVNAMNLSQSLEKICSQKSIKDNLEIINDHPNEIPKALRNEYLVSSGQVLSLQNNSAAKMNELSENNVDRLHPPNFNYSSSSGTLSNNNILNNQIPSNGIVDSGKIGNSNINFVISTNLNSQQQNFANSNGSKIEHDMKNEMSDSQSTKEIKSNYKNGIDHAVNKIENTGIPLGGINYSTKLKDIPGNIEKVFTDSIEVITDSNNGLNGRQQLISRQIRKNSVAGGTYPNESNLEYFPLNPNDELDLSLLQGTKNYFSIDNSFDGNNKIIFTTPTKPPFMYDSWFGRIIEKLEKSENDKIIFPDIREKPFFELISNNLNHIHVDKGALNKIIGKALIAEGTDEEQKLPISSIAREENKEVGSSNLEKILAAPVSISSTIEKEETEPVYPRAMEKWKEKIHSSNRRSINEFGKSSATTASDLKQSEYSRRVQSVNVLFPKSSLVLET